MLTPGEPDPVLTVYNSRVVTKVIIIMMMMMSVFLERLSM